jgi:hypothetical protein
MAGEDSNGRLGTAPPSMEKPIFSSVGDAPVSHFDTDEERAPKQIFPVYNELELVSEADLSIAAILKGTAASPLTNFEKKAALINA